MTDHPVRRGTVGPARLVQGPGLLDGDVHLDVTCSQRRRRVGDLLLHFPRRYVSTHELSEVGEPVEGEQLSVVGRIVSSEIKPFVDFSALDLVGVAVPAGTRSDRALVKPTKGEGR